MRRGLKLEIVPDDVLWPTGFKPIPDEEGTETRKSRHLQRWKRRFKPIPDEEGTETQAFHRRADGSMRLQTDPR